MNARVQQRDEERQHAEMAPVVEQRQEAAIEPRQRPDRQDDRQHEEGAGAERADAQIDRRRQVLGRVEPIRQSQIAADIERDAGEQDAVVDELRRGSTARRESRRSWLEPLARAAGAPASGGGRSTSAIAKPSATAKASTGQSTR